MVATHVFLCYWGLHFLATISRNDILIPLSADSLDKGVESCYRLPCHFSLFLIYQIAIPMSLM